MYKETRLVTIKSNIKSKAKAKLEVEQQFEIIASDPETKIESMKSLFLAMGITCPYCKKQTGLKGLEIWLKDYKSTITANGTQGMRRGVKKNES